MTVLLRAVALVVVLLAAGLPGAGWADAPEVARLDDMGALRAAARQARLPILLVVSQSDCPYCELLSREILRPMILSGEYEQRVLIRELSIDRGADVRDFDGALVAPGLLAERYGAKLTPTLLFLDDRGTQIAGRIRGINTVEFFGYYLDRAIDEALAHVRSGK
jgi:thioredoxin-related protein